jgi:hypothetical protein
VLDSGWPEKTPHCPLTTCVHHELNAPALLIFADVESFSPVKDQLEWIIQTSFLFVQPSRRAQAVEFVQARTPMLTLGPFLVAVGCVDKELQRILNPHRGLHDANDVANESAQYLT